MFDHTPSDKFQLRGLGDLPSPANCYGCGSGTNEQGYVDLGVFVDYHGQMLLCYTCVCQVAEVIGCLVPLEVLEMKSQHERLARENKDLKAMLEDKNDELATVNGVLAFLESRATSVNDVPSSEVSEGARVSAPGSEGGESEPEESITESGHGDFGEIAEGDELKPAPAGIQL